MILSTILFMMRILDNASVRMGISRRASIITSYASLNVQLLLGTMKPVNNVSVALANT